MGNIVLSHYAIANVSNGRRIAFWFIHSIGETIIGSVLKLRYFPRIVFHCFVLVIALHSYLLCNLSVYMLKLISLLDSFSFLDDRLLSTHVLLDYFFVSLFWSYWSRYADTKTLTTILLQLKKILFSIYLFIFLLVFKILLPLWALVLYL